MEGHSRDYADEISDLSNALEEECGHRLSLEESHNDDHAKLKKDLDHALVVSRVLNSGRLNLGLTMLDSRRSLIHLTRLTRP